MNKEVKIPVKAVHNLQDYTGLKAKWKAGKPTTFCRSLILLAILSIALKPKNLLFFI